MIDTHAHLHLMEGSPKEVIQTARDAGVKHIVHVAIDSESIDAACSEEMQSLSYCSIAAGIHPLSVSKTKSLSTELEKIHAHQHAIVAVGEMGLDYKYGEENKAQQLEVFHQQMAFAESINKPIIIHSRQADEDMIRMANTFPKLPKVFHCFASSVDMLHALDGDSYYVSFTGMITYAKKGKLIRAIQETPLSRLMIETDAPYLTPKAMQGKRNHPAYIEEIAKKIAEVKQISLDEVKRVTTETALSFFSINV